MFYYNRNMLGWMIVWGPWWFVILMMVGVPIVLAIINGAVEELEKDKEAKKNLPQEPEVIKTIKPIRKRLPPPPILKPKLLGREKIVICPDCREEFMLEYTTPLKESDSVECDNCKSVWYAVDLIAS